MAASTDKSSLETLITTNADLAQQLKMKDLILMEKDKLITCLLYTSPSPRD